MTRGHLLLAASAAAAAAGLGLGLGLSLGLSANAAGPPHGGLYSEQPVVLDCTNAPLVRPADYVITCADGGISFTHIHWTTWQPGFATATATDWVNDCTPFCYDGHFHGYPAYIVFWGSAAVKGHPGEQQYTELTAIYPGSRPPAYKNGKPVEGPLTTTGPLPPFYAHQP
jgi:hypothetical protein